MSNAGGIRTVAVCGAGQMGKAAAVSFARAGYDVLVWNHRPQTLEGLLPAVERMGRFLDEHGGPPAGKRGTVTAVTDLAAADERADLVLDCIVEDMDRKVALFASLGRCIEREAIFCTTTSGLSITEMASKSGCGRLLAGTHFWNPPHLMPLVEVVRGEQTADSVIDAVCDVVRSIGKIPVRVNRDAPGFIGNRLLHSMWREAIHLVEAGIASAEDVDLVVKMTFGLRMPVVGPLENMDLVGLDLVETIHRYLLRDLADNDGPSPLLSRMVGGGETGMKGGRGFYDWSKRDPEELIRQRDEQIMRQLRAVRDEEG